MLKCEFNKVALQLYLNHTAAWLFSCKFAASFQKLLLRTSLDGCFQSCIKETSQYSPIGYLSYSYYLFKVCQVFSVNKSYLRIPCYLVKMSHAKPFYYYVDSCMVLYQKLHSPHFLPSGPFISIYKKLQESIYGDIRNKCFCYILQTITKVISRVFFSLQKQPTGGVLRKMCSKNMQQT